jgi:predicted PurR-regulated permease PerM
MKENQNKSFQNITAALFLVGFSCYILKELQSILLPLFVALIISFLFEPLYEWLKKKKFPSWAAILAVVIVILIVSNIASVFVYTSINTFTTGIPKYIQKVEGLGDKIIFFINTLGISNDKLKETLDFSKFFSGEKVAGLLSVIISGIAGIFTNYVLILIYIIFLLSEFSSIKLRILAAFSKSGARTIADTMSDIFIDLRKYIVGKTLINFSHAFILTIIFLIFGLDFAIVWGLLFFFLTWLPQIGAFIATIFPLLIAFAQYDNILTPIVLMIIMVAVGYIMGSFIEPRILGNKLNLSPLLLIFSLVFWGWMWGIVGMLLSVPVMSMIKIILSKFESTNPIAILMSNEVVYSKTNKEAELNFPGK